MSSYTPSYKMEISRIGENCRKSCWIGKKITFTTQVIPRFPTDRSGQTAFTQIRLIFTKLFLKISLIRVLAICQSVCKISLIRVLTICQFVCIFWMHYSLAQQLCSNLRITATIFLDVHSIDWFLCFVQRLCCRLAKTS